MNTDLMVRSPGQNEAIHETQDLESSRCLERFKFSLPEQLAGTYCQFESWHTRLAGNNARQAGR